MRILLVNDYSERIGGTEVYLETLSRALMESGHEVKFYFGSYNYLRSSQQKNKLQSKLNTVFSLQHFLAYKRVLKEFHPDLIHVQNIFNEVSPSILLCSKNIPVLMTLHDYSIIQAVAGFSRSDFKKCKKEFCQGCINCVGWKGTLFEKVKRFIHSRLLNRVNTFIAPSEYMKNVIEQNSRFRPVLLHNGFNLSDPPPFNSTNSILFSGRITKVKGVDWLIDSLPLVLMSIPDLKLFIAGEGDLKDFLIDKVCRLGLTSNVTFLGHLSSRKMYNTFAKSSVLVVPSIWNENLPTVCIEAQSLGKPIVANNRGGIPEIVKDGETGFLCDSSDFSSLSRSIIKILSNIETLELFSKKAVKSAQQFSISLHIERLSEIYINSIRT